MSDLKQETVRGMTWGLLQRLTIQPLNFLYGIILARLISPEEFGILGLTAIFFSVANVLRDAGIGSALIRKQERSEEDCSTMFWFNWAASCAFGGLLYLLAPWFAEFYSQPELLWLTRVSALVMCVCGTTGVHMALYAAKRDFRTPAILQTISAVLPMPVCIWAAYEGWGVWALLLQQVLGALLLLALVWWRSPWYPRLMWSGASFRSLFSFGSKLAATSVLQTLYDQLRSFIIGKFYSAATLGYYQRGLHVAEVVPGILGSVVTQVSYPILSTLQKEPLRLRTIYRRYIRVCSLPQVWITATMLVLAEPLVRFVYGEAWMPCVVYLQIYCVAVASNTLNGLNGSLMSTLGRSDLMLRLEVIKKTIATLMIIGGACISPVAICWAVAIYSYIAIYLNSYYTGRLIRLSLTEQLKDYLPYFIYAAVAVLPAYGLTRTGLPDVLVLMLGGSLSLLLYLGMLTLRHDAGLGMLLRLLVGSKYKLRFLARWEQCVAANTVE